MITEDNLTSETSKGNEMMDAYTEAMIEAERAEAEYHAACLAGLEVYSELAKSAE